MDIIKNDSLIGIIGAGVMGRGIAQAFIQCGFKAALIDKETKILKKAEEYIFKGLDKLVELGKITEEQRLMFSANLILSDKIEDLKDSCLIIEAVNEDIVLKQKILYEASLISKNNTVFASNTSTLSIDKIAEGIRASERFIGLHFFNPAEKMKLVEIIPSSKTHMEIIDFSLKIMAEINKSPVVCKDSPGFIINRLLLLFLNESIKTFEENVADYKEIDRAVKEGLSHPMGPFEIADLIGLDLLVSLLDILQKDLGERYKPSKILKEMVGSGRLGRKNKKGFYDY